MDNSRDNYNRYSRGSYNRNSGGSDNRYYSRYSYNGDHSRHGHNPRDSAYVYNSNSQYDAHAGERGDNSYPEKVPALQESKPWTLRGTYNADAGARVGDKLTRRHEDEMRRRMTGEGERAVGTVSTGHVGGQRHYEDKVGNDYDDVDQSRARMPGDDLGGGRSERKVGRVATWLDGLPETTSDYDSNQPRRRAYPTSPTNEYNLRSSSRRDDMSRRGDTRGHSRSRNWGPITVQIRGGSVQISRGWVR